MDPVHKHLRIALLVAADAYHKMEKDTQCARLLDVLESTLLYLALYDDELDDTDLQGIIEF
jgi:hypothetical protein